MLLPALALFREIVAMTPLVVYLAGGESVKVEAWTPEVELWTSEVASWTATRTARS